MGFQTVRDWFCFAARPAFESIETSNLALWGGFFLSFFSIISYQDRHYAAVMVSKGIKM